MEYKLRKVVCQNCKNNFTIEPDDFGFYEKIKVPPPTFCPECRRQRRWAWRNNISLYNRKCEICGKGVISIYSLDSKLTIYCNKCWWSDKWDAKSFGVDYDFSKPFFTQFRELIQKVPHMSVVNDDGIASLNCEYTHDWWFSKNCYMCFSGWHTENIMYSFYILAGRDMVDSMNIRSKSEKLYECITTSLSYQVKYAQYCLNLIDSQFIYDCWNCSNCFLCAGLRDKKFCFKNKQYSKEEYEKILSDYRLDTFSGMEKAIKEYKDLILKYPRRYVDNFHNAANVIGDVVSYSKNVKSCFVTKNAENCRYCEFSGGAGDPIKDCSDLSLTGGSSECYECMTADHSQLNLFALFSVKSQDIRYTQHCHNCKHCFGCVGLRNANYCIFNKQYTKEDYEKLVPKIIEQMNKIPYRDKQGIEYRYGEYYPIELSYFGYNESCAVEQLPLTKEEAFKRGYNWQDKIQRTTGKETLKPEEIPESINDVDDSILDEILVCIECKRNYKIVQNELNFYRKMKIPIPRRCFYCRHANRVKRRNPFKLWHRRCMCGLAGSPKTTVDHGHAGQCENEFETSYPPDKPEIVYCEKCYQQEVY